MDGDVKITQSNAILRYIARKHNLLGTDEKEMIRVDMFENEVCDFRSTWVGLCYNPSFVSCLDHVLLRLFYCFMLIFYHQIE